MQEHLFYLTNFTNLKIEQAVNSFLGIGNFEGKEPNNASFNCFQIGELIMSITDRVLLKRTINLLIEKGYLQGVEHSILIIDRIVNQPEFTAAAALRIKAICYGILLNYECYRKKFQKYNSSFPQLQFTVNDGRVISNLDDVKEDVNSDFIIHLKDEIKKSPKNEQKSKLEEAIRIMGELSIDYNTDEFKKHIERLSTLKENPSVEGNAETPTESLNYHPRMFPCPNAFKLFEAFKENVVKPLADFSYIYRKMVKDELMYDIKDSEYRTWLHTTYNIEIENTKQLYRCETPHKSQIYYNLKAENKPYNSHN